MKILLILWLLISPCFSKVINLEWDANPIEQNVSTYFVMIGGETPIYKGDNTYVYDTYKYSETTSTQIEVSDTKVSYITIMAYGNGVWSSSAPEIKHTPNRVMKIEEILANDPNTNQLSLKVSIIDDIGRYVLMESSDDLVIWGEYGKFIIGENDIFVKYVAIDRPRRFFRYSYVAASTVVPFIAESPTPVQQIAAAQPIEHFVAPKKPKQVIKTRKNKHANISRKTWAERRKRK